MTVELPRAELECVLKALEFVGRKQRTVPTAQRVSDRCCRGRDQRQPA